MYEELDWPVAVQELIQAAEYLVGTGSPKVNSKFCLLLNIPLQVFHTALVTCQILSCNVAVRSCIVFCANLPFQLQTSGCVT